MMELISSYGNNKDEDLSFLSLRWNLDNPAQFSTAV
jgi:hypothetical protein